MQVRDDKKINAGTTMEKSQQVNSDPNMYVYFNSCDVYEFQLGYVVQYVHWRMSAE
jgi:hypothetical protein